MISQVNIKEKVWDCSLQRASLVGDTVKISTIASDNQFTGILMPRYESADENHLVIKLKSGYNIGIELTTESNL